MKIKWAYLLIFVAITLAIGSIGTIFSPGEWYQSLNKPTWVPANNVFAPIWSILYLFIALVGFLLWRQIETYKYLFFLWLLQLILNALWSPIFFGLQAPIVALLDILILDIAVLILLVELNQKNRTAMFLLLPYLVWIIFASALNFEIVRLNF
jgi:tryptophan-rich sensory protein